MDAIEVMESIETIVEQWQEGSIDSEEALQKITELIESL
jgi:hypothetical protein